MRRMLMPFAILAFLLQATLPFLIVTCPVYDGGPAASVRSDMTDCPMAGMAHAAPAGADQSFSMDGKVHKQAGGHCPLCLVMLLLGSSVAAGLIDLPPPGFAPQKPVFTAVRQSQARSLAAVFSARAPPGLI